MILTQRLGATQSRVMHQIRSVVDRTVGSIEQDMATQQSSSNTSTPHYQAQQIPNRPVKHEEYGPPSRQVRPHRSATNTPTPGSAKDPMSLHRGNSGSAMGGGTSYYNSPMTQMNTAYSQMGYPELAASGVPPPPAPATTTASTMSGSYMTANDDPQQQQHQHQHHQQHHHHQYLYAASAAAQLGHNTPASSPQSATAPNPSALVGYGAPQPQPPVPPSQHHHSSHPHPHPHAHNPHHQAQATGGAAANWITAVPASGTPWNEWTNAMVDQASQDRYSANALLTLGVGQRGPGDTGGGEMGVGGHPGVPTGQSGQWPMLVFHPNVSGA